MDAQEPFREITPSRFGAPRKAGAPPEEARVLIEEFADKYLGALGVSPST